VIDKAAASSFLKGLYRFFLLLEQRVVKGRTQNFHILIHRVRIVAFPSLCEKGVGLHIDAVGEFRP
jgi:hypothetical protein